jgi:Na+-transporting NADH:ubiquinone oxidoreductase subunit C
MSTERLSKARERLGTVLFMFAVTFVSISAVSAIHLFTAETVRQNETLFMKRAVLEACGMDEELAGRDAILAAYDDCVTQVDGWGGTYYRIAEQGGGAHRGFVFVCDGAGLWGTITAVVGLDAELAALTGLTFVKQNETPGLGARISEDWFKKQFRGMAGPFTYVDEGTRSESKAEFDAITGATITTRAVRDILNRAVAEAPGMVSPGP